MRRIEVVGECAPRCPSCVACRTDTRTLTADEALSARDGDEITLGGGDVTKWPGLSRYLAVCRERYPQRKIWIDAPAAALDEATVRSLAAQGVTGVIVQIEALGAEMIKALRVGDGERAVADAERHGLAVQVRLLVRPKTFRIVAPLARRLAPRPVWLEIVRQDWGKPSVPMPIDTIAQLFAVERNLRFSVHRMCERGYLPPCALPEVWTTRPDAYRAAIGDEGEPNRTFPACHECALARRCQFRDREAVADDDIERLTPVRDAALPWERGRTEHNVVPMKIVNRRDSRDVICTTPWTTLEVVDPDGRVRQCCSTWTAGDRGNVFEGSLLSIWNGEGYQRARRIMAGDQLDELCLPICSRLHDRKYAESAFMIQRGSEPFVQNQLLIAEEIATRAEVVRSKPLKLSLCPSTYCNYNCIMCDHGRSPRRELPEHLWDELPGLLPTLQSLTLLGGEPLAHPRTLKLLQDFDVAKTPDVAIDFVTNGSLLTAKVLKHLHRCTLGDITFSLNAGTPETYERVQRGIALERVHENIDNLIEFRRNHHRWFGITVSFVVQPAASHTLIEFAEFAHQRNLRIRLMALNPEHHEGLDFYQDEDAVQRVLRDVDRVLEWSKRVRPEWVSEIAAARAAVVGEARERQRGVAPALNVKRLPVVP